MFGFPKEKILDFWNHKVMGNQPDHGAETAPVKVAQSLIDGEAGLDIHSIGASSTGIHNMLRYDVYDPQTGLFYNEGSISFAFEVIAQTGANKQMEDSLNQLFTPIPPGYGIQWVMCGSPMVDDAFETYIELRKIAVDKGLTDPFFVELAERRVKFFTKQRGQPLFPASNFMIKTMRLVFSVTKEGSYKDKQTVRDMIDLLETLQAQLKTSNLPAFRLDAAALIKFLTPILNPAIMFTTENMMADVGYDDGKAIKNQLTPFGHQVRVKNSEILFGAPPETEHDEDHRIAARAFSILQYPKSKELWQMANIIGALFDDGLQYPCPFVISGGMFTLDPAELEQKIPLKAARAQQNAASKMAQYQPELGLIHEDWQAVLHQQQNGGMLTHLYHSLIIFSPKKQINKNSQIALNIWRNERFTIGPLDSLHLPLFYASLPMTLTSKVRDDLMKFRVASTKTTANAVSMSPVIGEWQGAGQPVILFAGRRGTPTFIDLFSNQQGNYNIFVAGVSGSGKSVALNEIISAYRGVGARVWVIDVGRSYKNLTALQNGQFIEFTRESTFCINPFSWVGQDESNKFEDELRMLKPMIARMASPNAPITDYQYAIIERAITEVWRTYGNDTDPTKIADFLLNYKNESGGNDRIAFELGQQLGPYTQNGMYGQYFNGKADLTLNHDMICLELEELKSAPELRRVILFILTSRIAHDMYLSRDRMKLCLVDEAWQLLGDDAETAAFIEEGYRRARKYKGSFAVGTQSVLDAYMNKAASAAYNNADWKLLLRQDPKSLDKLMNDGTVNFSPSVLAMLRSLRTEGGRFSEILISSPNGDNVVRHIPDPYSLLMASSKAEDFVRISELTSQGYSTSETIKIMLNERGIQD